MHNQNGLIRQYSWELGIVHRLIDASVIALILWLAVIGYGANLVVHYQISAFISIISFWMVAEWHALYKSWRVDSLWREARTIFIVWMLTCAVLLVVGFLSKSTDELSRVSTLVWAVTTPLMLIGVRTIIRRAIRHFRKQGFNSRSVAIIGCGKQATKLLDVISKSPWMGLHVEGVYDNSRACE
ncbi:MAG: hypothetical protein KKA63_07660, partial [Gammaproteobacteria bacterium]|nr:hypothetical protein [Gammaproteobacteria bacterium]